MATVEGQVQRLTAAISASGQSPALLAALQTTETRRAALEQTLATLGRQRQITDLDVPSLQRDLRHRLVDWQGLLNRHVPQARQILRKLLPHPLTLTPRIEGKTRQYEFKGQASLGNVLTGVMDAGGRSTSGAIPFWFDTVVIPPSPEDDPAVLRPLSEQVIDHTDSVALMDYRTAGVGSNGTLALGESELLYASQ